MADDDQLTPAWAPLGHALAAYLDGDHDATVALAIDDGRHDVLPAAALFRANGLTPADEMALALTRGRVLDAGAGAGTITLRLEDAGHEVVALDVDPGAVAVMKRRGVTDPRLGDLFSLGLGRDEAPFDTVLLLMNGIGVAGDLAGLDRLFEALHRVVAPDGVVLADGADLTRAALASTIAGTRSSPPRAPALPSPAEPPPVVRSRAVPPKRHPGELCYRMSYGDDTTATSSSVAWLFVDPDTLADTAERNGWWCQIIFADDDGSYLARFTRVA